MKAKLHLVTPFALAAFTSVSAQGPITPPGAPGPTMKTLDQVEPRTPINDAAVPGDANYHHIITRSGSYYLTGNLAVTKLNGIDVRTEGVTIDLNGFEIGRTAGAGGNGIEVDAAGHRCTLRNGSLKGFAYGSAHGNTGHSGIFANPGCTLINCSATDNTVTRALSALGGCTLKNCAARSNTWSGLVSGGIDAGTGSTIIGCSATENTNTNAADSPSAGYGIVAGIGSTVRDCTTEGNKGDGISIAGDRCHVSGNTCTGNTSGGQGAGIHLRAGTRACRIDGNHCSGGTRGIWVESTDNLIIRNSVEGTSELSYDIAAGNHSAAIINGPGLSFASTSPWANFRF